MPRCARIKTENSIFHIMVKSVGDLALYKNNNDKNKFLSLIKKYKSKFYFKVYSYCIMTNHAHLIIDASGADISDVMHGINQSYAQYFNRKYNRCGHVFQDRFKSKIVDTDRYLYTLSAYIHNNPHDMKKFKNCVEKYQYSSLGVFLGIRKDLFKILDEAFIMQFFGSNKSESRKNYIRRVHASVDLKLKKEFEFKFEKSNYLSERKIINRNFNPNDVLDFVLKFTESKKENILLKYSHNNIKNKAILVLLLKCFCKFKHKDVCKFIGNITESRVSGLWSIAARLVCNDKKYNNVVDDFLNFKTA